MYTMIVIVAKPIDKMNGFNLLVTHGIRIDSFLSFRTKHLICQVIYSLLYFYCQSSNSFQTYSGPVSLDLPITKKSSNIEKLEILAVFDIYM